MRFIAIALIAAAGLLTGCTNSYTIYLNGYCEQPRPFPAETSFYIAGDVSSDNQIFDNQIKAKIESLLEYYGYKTSHDPRAADYRMTFGFMLSSHKINVPRYTGSPAAGFYDRDGAFANLGYGYYPPYLETMYQISLTLKIYTADKILWLGEAATENRYADKRQAVDYLIVALLEHLGHDTKHRKIINIPRTNPAVIHLSASR